jgi:hypothetical protein
MKISFKQSLSNMFDAVQSKDKRKHKRACRIFWHQHVNTGLVKPLNYKALNKFIHRQWQFVWGN